MKKRVISLIMAIALMLPAVCVNAAEEAVNVILNVEASATSSIGDENLADKANDGINDNKSYTYWKSNEDDKMPSWQADMALSFAVSKIELEARKENEDATERMNFKILGANEANFSDAVVLAEVGDEDFGEVLTVSFENRVRARFIKVQKTKEGPLSIGEIKVFANKDEILQGAESNNPDYVKKEEIATTYDGELTDVLGTKYESDVMLIAALGIINGYPDGTFRPENPITRAEFMKIAFNLLPKGVGADTVSFTDVPKTHWAYNYIETAAKMDIVDGTSETTFSPEAQITANQAIKILVSILGYKDMAELQGGYPKGYVTIATDLDMLEDVTLTDSAISRGEVAVMVSNALETYVLKTEQSVNSSTSYREETLMEKRLKVSFDEGIVTGVTGTSLTRANDITDEEGIKIDGVLYKTKIENKEEYLGLKVKFYYDTKDDEPYEIVAIIADEDNEVLEIDAKDIQNVDFSTVTYYKGSKTQKADLQSDMDVLYNGFALRDYEKADLRPDYGTIKLIDNDKDGDIDVYFVNKAVAFVAGRVNSKDLVITSKNGAGILTVDEDKDYLTITDKDGNIVSFDSINEGNVLLVYESKKEGASKNYKIVVSDTFVDGVLSGISGEFITVGDTEYEAAPCFDVEATEAGEYARFYIDAFGRVVFSDDGDATTEEYGILMKVLPGEDDEDNMAVFKIFTAVGSFETFNADCEKLTVDGNDVANVTEIKTHIAKKALDKKAVQLIRYKKNAKSEIISVDTLQSGKNEKATALTEDFASAQRYFENTGIIGQEFAVDTNTVMFKIPSITAADEQAGNYEAYYDEEEYKVLTTATISPSAQHTMSGYDGGDEKIMKCVIFTSLSGDTDGGSGGMVLVSDIENCLDENGDVAVKVSGIANGNEVSYYAYDEAEDKAKTVDVGDVVYITAIGANKIKSINTVYSSNNVELKKPYVTADAPVYGSIGDYTSYVYGKISSMKNGFLVLEYKSGDTTKELMLSASAFKIYMYDSEDDTVQVCDPSYIFDEKSAGAALASDVLVRLYFRTEKELIIFK